MEETNLDTEWKLNIVYELMEKRFGTSFTKKEDSEQGLACDMVGIVSGDQNAERTAQARQRKRYFD